MKKTYTHTITTDANFNPKTTADIEVEFIPFKMKKTEINRTIYDVIDVVKSGENTLFSQIENITTTEKGYFLCYGNITINDLKISTDSKTFLAILEDASYYLDVPCTIKINGKPLLNNENGLATFKKDGYEHKQIILNAKSTHKGEYIIGNTAGSMLSPITLRRSSYLAV